MPRRAYNMEHNMPDKFLVWNPDRGYPTTCHLSFDSAVREAERLAAANPGQSFFVMAPAGECRVEKPTVFRTNPNFQYVPF